MVKFIRYSLATLFFAASVGCLALWWRSFSYKDILNGPTYVLPMKGIYFESFNGNAWTVLMDPRHSGSYKREWRLSTHGAERELLFASPKPEAKSKRLIRFPLWYPALIFALASIAVTRVRRRIRIWSVFIATTIVAGLLEIAVLF